MKQRFGKFDLEFLPRLSAQGNPTGRDIIPSTPMEMGNMLEFNLKFAKDKGRILYYYEDGIYKSVADNIHIACMAIYEQYGDTWTTNKDSQVMDYLTKRAPELLEQPLEDRINLQNGLYFIHENRFESHNEIDHSDYLTTVQIPINYDPNATCPNITQFMQDIFVEGWELLFDVVGICMTSNTGGHVAVILLGGGCNGKSVYLYGLRSLVGFNNVSTTPMHTLADAKDRFANNDLVGKLANVGDDTQMDKILETSNIKSIISGNHIRVEGKFRNSYTYKPFCKLVFASNHRLESSDSSVGYNRRIVHVPLMRTFAKNPAIESNLLAMFADETERSGVFNEICKRLSTTCKYGLQIPEDAEDMVNNYDPIPVEVEDWLKKVVTEDEGGRVVIREFFTAYLDMIEQPGNMKDLYRYIKQLFPKVTKGRPRIDGVQVPCYIGIRVDEATSEFMKHVMKETEYLDPDSSE